MATMYDQNPLRADEASRERSKKADRFWQAFLITENGKVKSSLLLNSFCLSFVFLAVYAAAYCFLVDPLYALTDALPVFVGNLVGAVVPAVVGTAICCLTFGLFKERRTVLCTYIWLLLFALACLITMVVLLWGETHATLLLLQFFALFIAGPVLLGGAASMLLYHRWQKSRAILAGEDSSVRRRSYD